MDKRVTCIAKDGIHGKNPYYGITKFGFSDDTSFTHQEMINYLDGGRRAYVFYNGRTNYCYVVRRTGDDPYVRTMTNGTERDNLLSLPSCA